MLLLAVLPSLIAAFQQPLQLSVSHPEPRPDSARVRHRAERAQANFELRRRSALPVSYSSAPSPCDLRIGRFCYWRDDGVPDTPPPEPGRITSARKTLLAALDSAAALLPGDEWIAGQLVRYRLDAHDARGAIAAAAGCAGVSWWCDALSGLALHVAGDDVAADSAFARALTRMPDDERCRWSDLSDFAPSRAGDDGRRCASRTDAARRDSAAARMWWLAQPLYLLPTNDLRVEYFARRTMARLERMARGAYDTSWGSDVEVLTVRFGWPTWWTRSPPRPGVIGDQPAVAGHERSPGWDFLPAGRLVDSSDAPPREGDWALDRHPGLLIYAPLYARVVRPLAVQLARFRRGDSVLVAARWGLGAADGALRDTLPASDETGSMRSSPVAALALGRDEQIPMVIASEDSARSDGTLRCMAPWHPRVASVELLDARHRFAARWREMLTPDTASGFALSDLLLFKPGPAPVGSLDEVLPAALPVLAARSGDKVGVYWESYGLPERAEVSVMLTLERVRVGWASRLAERLHLASRSRPVRLRWRETTAPAGGFTARVLSVDLSGLASGHYLLRLTQQLSDGRTATRERELAIVDGS